MINKIPYVNLIKQTNEEKNEIFKSLNNIFKTGQYILGDDVDNFEKKISPHQTHLLPLQLPLFILVQNQYLLMLKKIKV